MNRKFWWITIGLIFTGALPLYLLAQPETITINNTTVFKTKSRAPVLFTHAQHMTLEGVSCTDCHHWYYKGKNILDPAELTEGNIFISCAVCHKEKSDLEQAYHRQCIGCHEKIVKAGKAAGPRMCGECHKKN